MKVPRFISKFSLNTAVREIWFVIFRQRLQRAYSLLRIRRGLLSVGFHHEMLGWAGMAKRVAEDIAPLPPPINLRDSVNPDWQQEHIFEARAVWLLSETVVDSKSGVVYLNGSAVLDSANGSATKPLRKWAPLITRGQILHAGPIIPLGQNPANYYHWLVEDLPVALRAREYSREAVALISSNQPGYVEQSLRFFGFSSPLRAKGKVRVNNVIVPSRNLDNGWPRPDDVALLRSFEAFASPLNPTRRRIYVSRRGSRRSLRNEIQLEQLLQASGFEIVHLENMAFEEQVSLFSQVDIVVGAHGAGLSNMIFAPSSSRLLELVTPDRAIQCFESICQTVGINYKRIFLEADRSTGAPLLSSTGIRLLRDSIS